MSEPGVEVAIAIPADASPRDFPTLERSGFSFLDQGPGDLGERLTHVLETALDLGARSVALVGSDHPNLPLSFVRAACDVAAAGDMGWIPTADGGFAAIASARACPGLFRDVPWSTPEVAGAIRRNASRAGLRLVETGTWYDIDTGEDLLRLARELEPGGCPETERTLNALEPPLGKRALGLPLHGYRTQAAGRTPS
jgi:glycosyltransferase A (GT-A) superfamily protein (DUF2064 family)